MPKLCSTQVYTTHTLTHTFIYYICLCVSFHFCKLNLRIFLSSVVKFLGWKQIQFALQPTSLKRERARERETLREEKLFKMLRHFRLSERERWRSCLLRVVCNQTVLCAGAGAAAGAAAGTGGVSRLPTGRKLFKCQMINAFLMERSWERESKSESRPRRQAASEFNKQLPWRHGCSGCCSCSCSCSCCWKPG